MGQVQPIRSDCDACGSERAFDPETFRDAMARLAGGVAVAACWDGAEPKGLLVSSLTGLSMEPPRVLFCVRKAASTHNPLLKSRDCSLSILSEDDQEDAERFSRVERTAERFDPSLWSLDRREPPRRLSAMIGLTGHLSHRIDARTHTIFILDVQSVQTRDGAPLVYFDRAFRGLRPKLV